MKKTLIILITKIATAKDSQTTLRLLSDYSQTTLRLLTDYMQIPSDYATGWLSVQREIETEREAKWERMKNVPNFTYMF